MDGVDGELSAAIEEVLTSLVVSVSIAVLNNAESQYLITTQVESSAEADVDRAGRGRAGATPCTSQKRGN